MLLSTEKQIFIDLIHQSEFDHALMYANELNNKYPDNETIYNMLGDAFLMKEDKESSIKCFQYSLSLNPDQVNVYLTLGKLYDILGRTNDSFEVYSQSLELEPENTNVLSRVGEFLSSLGYFDDALALIKSHSIRRKKSKPLFIKLV